MAAAGCFSGAADAQSNSYKAPAHLLCLEDRYALGPQVGWGKSGVIRSCSDLVTGDELTCKSIAKDRLLSPDDVGAVKLEIEIMARLSGHPNVVNLEAVYEDEDSVHLVMEHCSGGELFHRLEQRGCFSEHEACVLFRYLMEVVAHCHSKGIVHRDLKPENILLVSKSASSPIKLADFRLATYIQPGQSLSSIVGSPFYVAPEMLSGGYNEAADMWSAGVILYILLSGIPPFWGKTKSKVFDSIRSTELRFPSDPWDRVSDSAKELVTGLLQRDPRQRLTAKEVLDHLWMQEHTDQSQSSFSCCHEIGLRREDPGSGGSIVCQGMSEDKVCSPTFMCRSSLQMDSKTSTAHNILEHMLLDESAKPTKLPLSLLEAITNNFSNEQEIGRGGFAVVYKGILGNCTVAVKKLFKTVDVHEKTFGQEVQCLMKVRHKNIVRFLGYCADTQGEMAHYEGKFVMADVRNRLLCFEFVPNGSLYDYITDASCEPDWRVRYQMIKGICEGLHYLHENKIVHLDLKPGNILLDDNMMPKIADFGLSKCFDKNQSKAITSKLIGSMGYLAPEFYNGHITFKLDIYSLGVIIIELLTGQKGYCAVEKVLEIWRNRLEISQEDILLQEVQACAEIGIMCIDSNPEHRPVTQYIIKTFKELGPWFKRQ